MFAVDVWATARMSPRLRRPNVSFPFFSSFPFSVFSSRRTNQPLPSLREGDYRRLRRRVSRRARRRRGTRAGGASTSAARRIERPDGETPRSPRRRRWRRRLRGTSATEANTSAARPRAETPPRNPSSRSDWTGSPPSAGHPLNSPAVAPARFFPYPSRRPTARARRTAPRSRRAPRCASRGRCWTRKSARFLENAPPVTSRDQSRRRPRPNA
mmetsp:Transcript_1980/g.7872  ORF Transcript_1980/g.7872 Transcript_1980/m.7872 type:complete len:213 (-) Transcript_1980:1938-2576(-)